MRLVQKKHVNRRASREICDWLEELSYKGRRFMNNEESIGILFALCILVV